MREQCGRIMQAPRLEDVLTRVVAWHNRHPLARRIGVAQVHSVGEVLLPFASAQAVAAAAPAASVEPPRPAQPSAASLAAVVLARAAARPARPSWVPQAAIAEGPIDPADIDLALGDETGAADTAPDPGAAASDPAEPPDPPPDPPPDLPPEPAAEHPHGVAAATASAAAEVRRGGWLARLRLAGHRPALPRLEAAFARDFLWPLTPQQVARWARRHGQPLPLAPPDWPQRRVAPDPARLAALRQKGLSRSLDLHLLTAAIGVGDRRIRLLLDGSGHVLGPRAYSPRRIAVAAAALTATVLGALLPWLAADTGPAGRGAAVPIAAAIAASAPDESAIEPHATPASATAAAESTPPASAAAAVAEAQPARAEASAASEPAADAPAAPQADIRPQLSDDERRAAREQSERLRGRASAVPEAAAPAATGPVYAVVARPSRQREAAASDLVLMHSVAARLPPPAPDHAELMQTRGEWRAAWWPFASLADAERARVMLAGRGLKAEVVEF
ncbi:MAG: hypothetical protein JNL87_09065 [Burkholderiaceae bacterium]|nr:hypothetical protein [Burkholderiaceae bacterium]